MALISDVARGTVNPTVTYPPTPQEDDWWNAGKPDTPWPTEWQRLGFPDEASYNAVYGPKPSTPPAPVPLPPAAATPPPPIPSFADFLAANPGQRDAWVYLESLLNEYGLGELTSLVQGQIVQGRSEQMIVQELRTTDTYKRRFRVIEERKKRGLPALSEQEVVAYEKAATARMRAAKLPSGFWDQPEDFFELQVQDISLAELDSRINEGFVKASQASPLVRQKLDQLYGISEADLAAFFLDPDRAESVIMNNFGAAQRAARAQSTGYGQLSRTEAEGLVARGISDEQAAQGFSTLAANRELFSSLPGEGADEITREEQFGAAFDQNAQATQRIERRARQRAAEFGGTGGFTTDRNTTGIGAAR
jgi:hypothetical protein